MDRLDELAIFVRIVDEGSLARAAARLARTDLYGPISPPMQAWIDQMGLGAKLRHQGEAIAGFRRS